jgi:hypothetical protein
MINYSVGATSVVECTERMQKAIDRLQNYPITADDYVEYIMYMEESQEEVLDL